MREDPLFQPLRLGPLTLPNRVVMTTVKLGYATEVGEVTVVLEQGNGKPGLSIEYNDEAGPAGQAALHVLVEAAGNLDGKDGSPVEMGRFNVDFPMGV